MINLTDFSYDSQRVRVAGTFEDPLFVAKDVCAILGLENNRRALMELDAAERASVTISDTSPSPRKTITVNAVTESGLYALIFKSRKPEARKFARWVTSEVLPQIRKTGSYAPEMPRTYPEAMQRIGELVMQGKSQSEALSLVMPSGRFGEISPATAKPKTRLIASHYRTPRNGGPDTGAMRLQELLPELPLFGNDQNG